MACPTAPPGNHDRLRLDLMAAGRRMRATVEDEPAFTAARDALATFCITELLPHLERYDQWLAEADRCAEARLLAHAMRQQNRAATAVVHELAAATGPCDSVATTRVLHTLLAAQAHHEELLMAAIGEASEDSGHR